MLDGRLVKELYERVRKRDEKQERYRKWKEKEELEILERGKTLFWKVRKTIVLNVLEMR